MRIKKTSNTRALAGKVVNVNSESTTDTYSCDYINDCNTYSTNEINTGQTWIDGKPIYRKVIDNISMTIGTAQYINTGISNIREMIDIKSKITTDTQNFFGNQYYGSSIFFSVNYQKNNNKVLYDLAGSALQGTLQIVMYYTKTTD